ncbi:MAG: alpha,alpha-trehalase TreA [Chitinophagaceae bacterium]|nr:MAG: alpha,alpha-trehalase TreA [Chitinophagaceae bacterium]
MIKGFTFFTVLVIMATEFTQAQTVLKPEQLYGDLFRQVQQKRIFRDGKTFVDLVPKKKPALIMSEFESQKDSAFDLKKFIETNFIFPDTTQAIQVAADKDVRVHIKSLWPGLTRKPERNFVEGSSLLPLPYPYIVPGGRFREVYYWDSYFTMLGLKESGEIGLIENMINNFAYLLNQYGLIPNGNRSYYLSRSQLPLFSFMVELLAETTGNSAYAIYLGALEKEYDYWMDKSAPTKHVVKMPDGSILNRYYDQSDIPRQESWFEDDSLSKNLPDPKRQKLNRDLRSAAESGWDFSSRWFADGKSLATIKTTDFIPVDLNSFLYHLESVLARAYKLRGDLLKERYFTQIAQRRKAAINKYCWSTVNGWYVDYDYVAKTLSTNLTLAGMAPMFCNVAPVNRVKNIVYILRRKFLKPGGLVTTLRNTGQQWDSPNGWAPLQWIAVKGLINYEEKELAESVSTNWINLNLKVFNETGKLMEKYDVVDLTKAAGGGEYPSQDGFGWTNGVLMKMISLYGMPKTK